MVVNTKYNFNVCGTKLRNKNIPERSTFCQFNHGGKMTDRFHPATSNKTCNTFISLFISINDYFTYIYCTKNHLNKDDLYLNKIHYTIG